MDGVGAVGGIWVSGTAKQRVSFYLGGAPADRLAQRWLPVGQGAQWSGAYPGAGAPSSGCAHSGAEGSD